jgi:hypothetical protein
MSNSFSQVRRFSFAIIHSTTIGLPAWRKACTDHDLPPRLIPRDVRTRWNSVYDMLTVAVKYKDVINYMTGNHDLSYRQFEISNGEWTLLEDMLHVLKVQYML